MIQVAKKSILDITPYMPGASKVEGKKATIKLSSNESPFGASPKAKEALANIADQLHRYPEGPASVMRQAIGKVHHIDPEQIVCGAGSDEIISMLCQAYAGPNTEVLYSQYGFLMYAIYAKVAGATPIEAPAKELGTDVDALLAHVTNKTRLVFVANPNNPTGTYLPKDELVRLREGLPDHVLLVIDGAYAEYVEKEDYSAGQDLVEQYDNVVMLRTFSKIYGLAALRAGWAYAAPEVVDILHRVRSPFNVSMAAAHAAAAAVQDQQFISKVRQHNNTWLGKLENQLTNMGYQFHPSIGNFYLVSFDDVEAAFNHLVEHGIIVRKMAPYGLPNALRITVGLEEDNVKVLAALT